MGRPILGTRAGLVESRSGRDRGSIKGYAWNFGRTHHGEGVNVASGLSGGLAGPFRWRLFVCGFTENGCAPSASKLEPEPGKANDTDRSRF